MFSPLLAAVLLAAGQTPGDAAFDAARARQIAGRGPELVLLVEHPGGEDWETIGVHWVTVPSSVSFGSYGHWVVRRDRWEAPDDHDAAGAGADGRVRTSWAASARCPQIVPMLEEVERIPPVPYDVAGIGRDLNDDLIVGFARFRFWLINGWATPSIETYGDRMSAGWYLDADLTDCWQDEAPDE